MYRPRVNSRELSRGGSGPPPQERPYRLLELRARSATVLSRWWARSQSDGIAVETVRPLSRLSRAPARVLLLTERTPLYSAPGSRRRGAVELGDGGDVLVSQA